MNPSDINSTAAGRSVRSSPAIDASIRMLVHIKHAISAFDSASTAIARGGDSAIRPCQILESYSAKQGGEVGWGGEKRVKTRPGTLASSMTRLRQGSK